MLRIQIHERISARSQVRLPMGPVGPLAVGGATIASHLILVRDGMLMSLDSSTQYIPWYTYLGASLRDGRIPGWNPANFGGTPFAADPLSGWSYLPAMLLFSALPMQLGWQAIVVFHPLLGGLGTYALARSLGIAGPAAALAGVAYACSPFLQMHTLAAQPYAGVAAWLPLGLFGVERATQCARDRLQRVVWWSLAGLAVSQAIAVWPGQGSMYAVVVVSTYSLVAACTTLTCRSLPTRALWLVGHVGMPVLLGCLLAAAGLLPRLEFVALSNLAHGYATDAQTVGGWSVLDWWRVGAPGYWSAGITTLALATAGLALLRQRSMPPPAVRAAICLGVVSLAALMLASTMPTPLHSILYVLPAFERLHAHIPERIMIVAYLGPVLLAGIALHGLRARVGVARTALVGVGVLGLLLVEANLSANFLITARWDALRRVDSAYEAQPPAASYLQERMQMEDPFRFIGYGPAVLDGTPVPYTLDFASERTRGLLLNNRAITLGLEDVQGYSAIHLARFDTYLLALNAGQAQNYHDGYVLEAGLASPLLDMLNVRYLVVPATAPENAPAALSDAAVNVLQRPTALPRAWVVHEAVVSEPAAALAGIATGEVDPRRTAVVEFPLELPGGPPDLATVARADADVVRVMVDVDRPGLVVFADVYYPAWNAYVDGQPTTLRVVNGLLRGVEVAPGEHSVEVRFESAALARGIVISLLTAFVLGGTTTICVWRSLT